MVGHSNRHVMLRNYLLTTFRNIIRRKGFSALNILGLSIGLASSLLILQYVKDELSYDDIRKLKTPAGSTLGMEAALSATTISA